MDLNNKRALDGADDRMQRPSKNSRNSQNSSDSEQNTHFLQENIAQQLPNIIVSRDRMMEPSSEASSYVSLAIQTPTDKIQPVHTIAETESSNYNLSPTRSADSRLPNHRDFVFPEAISYTLHIILDKTNVPGTGDVAKVPANGGYTLIGESAEQLVRDSDLCSSSSKTLHFRYGTCQIVTKEGNSEQHALTSNENWSDVCTVLNNYYRSGRTNRFHLDIFREYFSLQTEPDQGVPFADTKRQEIHELMKPSISGGHYISRTDLVRITSSDTIRMIIMDDKLLDLSLKEKEAFVEQVCSRARKLLAICVHVSLKMACLKQLLDNDQDDDSLPLREGSDCHPEKCGAAFRELIKNQGSFMAPVFDKFGPPLKFSKYVQLPIQYHAIDQNERALASNEDVNTGSSSGSLDQDEDPEKQRAYCGSGAFSNVYRVTVDPDHQQLNKLRGSNFGTNNDFAIKEFHDRPKRVSDDFQKELDMQEELRLATSPDHVVTHFVAWTHGGKYYMLLPYATCNLNEYMRRRKFEPKNETLWLIEQFYGLAHALHGVHQIIKAPTPPSALVPADADPQKSGWHHDIKPENILFFPGKLSGLGTLRLADWGSGKVHLIRSGSVNTRTPSGTSTYEAPDGYINNRAISRPYDVWSLGCVFLQLLLWALCGHEAVSEFKTDRNGKRTESDVIEDDAFWHKDTNGHICRREAVENVITRLETRVLQHDAQSFKEILNLTVSMLDVIPTTRIKALDLYDALHKIKTQKAVEFQKIVNDSFFSHENTSSTTPLLVLEPPHRREGTTVDWNAPSLEPPIPGQHSMTASPTDIRFSFTQETPARLSPTAHHSQNPSLSSTLARRGSAATSSGGRSPPSPHIYEGPAFP